MKVPFGKHKGRDIQNVPADYLKWLLTLNDLRPPLRAAIEELLARYAGMKKKGGG